MAHTLTACFALLGLLGLATPTFAQAPFPGAVQYCPPDSDPGWAPAGHPVIAQFPCSPVFEPPPPPIGIASDPFVVGRFYRSSVAEFYYVMTVAQLADGQFVFVLQGLGVPNCNQVTLWLTRRPSPRHVREVPRGAVPTVCGT